MPTTLKDIAKLAGVSTATVSKVLNGKDFDIGEETIQTVQRIAKELNYRPNSLARSMKTKVTKTIGLIIPDVRNPFFTDLARGAEDSALERGYSLLFCNSDNDLKKEMDYIDTLVQKQVDGIALAAADHRNPVKEKKFQVPLPIVTLDREVSFKGVRGHIHTDNESGAYKAIHYLISLGHRRILFISGDLQIGVSKERLSGYIRALTEAGIDFDERLVFPGSYSFEHGFETMRDLSLDSEITAVFCGNDLIALGVIKALKERKIRVPQDISVMGFDDIYLASINTPSLTTVRQPSYQLGYQTVQRLIDILEGVDHADPTLIIQLELVIRESTAKLRKKNRTPKPTEPE